MWRRRSAPTVKHAQVRRVLAMQSEAPQIMCYAWFVDLVVQSAGSLQNCGHSESDAVK